MRRFLLPFMAFIATTLLAGEDPLLPDLARPLREASDAVALSDGITLERAVDRMRAELDTALISDHYAAALILLDLTHGPGSERLKSAAARHAVLLAPHLPDTHLRHAERLFSDGMEMRYWTEAFNGYLTALDQPLFILPLRDALIAPLRSGVQIPFLLFLLLLFLRNRERALRSYALPGADRPLAALMVYPLPAFLAGMTIILFSSAGPFLLLTLAALLVPITTLRERIAILFLLPFLCLSYAATTALQHLPPYASDAIETLPAFLSFAEPGRLGERNAPFLFHAAAAAWLFRHFLHALLFAAFTFICALGAALFLLRRTVTLCARCGEPLAPLENARPETSLCIVCEHIAERQRQIREIEVRRYREQATRRRQRSHAVLRTLSWIIPGAGQIARGRPWEGLLYLFGIAALSATAFLWQESAGLLVLYRPLSLLPAVILAIAALCLLLIAFLRTYLTEHRI